jgi:hypothetical protein
MDRLALVLDHQEKEPQRYLIGGNDLGTMVKKADELRKQGCIVELDLLSYPRQTLEDKLEGWGNCTLIYIDKE